MPDDFTGWIIATLWSMVCLLAGGFLGDVRGKWAVNSLRRELEAHEARPGHRESEARHVATDARMTRLETEIDRRLAGIEGRLERLMEKRG